MRVVSHIWLERTLMMFRNSSRTDLASCRKAMNFHRKCVYRGISLSTARVLLLSMLWVSTRSKRYLPKCAYRKYSSTLLQLKHRCANCSGRVDSTDSFPKSTSIQQYVML
uniref:Secreted protein n=1 Tax=Ascaris lumbricoides TaxID=6252 RepID=A0A0M3I1V6_ASCLU